MIFYYRKRPGRTDLKMNTLMYGKGDSLKGILIHRKRLYRHMLRLKLIKRRTNRK